MTFKITRQVSVSAIAIAMSLTGLGQAHAQARKFDVSEQSAATGLIDFANQADIQIVASTEDVRGKRTNRVVGDLSVDQGLESLISGTGLSITRNKAGTYVLVAPLLRESGPAQVPANVPAVTPIQLSVASEPEAGSAEAEQGTDDPFEEDVEKIQPVIIVTGSLISNPNATLSTPVNSSTADQILFKAANTAEELLRDIPGIVPGIGSSVNLANPGASFVNLRGLGDNRNLVLMDGTRLVPADIGGRFDLNNIPLALMERTDVLTGGASTTYGADAVSGVINFVTKSRFTGLELTLSHQVTEEGDGDTVRAEAVFGRNFADDRGNIILAASYQESEPVYQGDRPFGEFQFDSRTGLPSGSIIAAPTVFSLPGSGSRQMTPDGALAPIYAPYNFNPLNLYQTGFERYNFYGSASYELSNSIEVYGRAIRSQNTVNVILAPGGAFGSPVQIPLNNPYLPVAARNQFCAANGIGADACLAASEAIGPEDPAYRAVASSMSRRGVEGGSRFRNAETEFQDYKIGLRGAFTRDIDWDVFAAYGESTNTILTDPLFRNSRIRQSLQATRDAAGNIVCVDPSNGCVATDWFGPEGAITPEMNAFLTGQSEYITDVSMAQFNGKVSGSTGWSVPSSADTVSFALGGEYRLLEASQSADALVNSGDFSGAGGATPDTDGAYSVWEVFGELVAPLVQDRPFIRDLTFEAGIRNSNYTLDAPGDPSFNTTTWKVGGGWAPVASIRFRGNYSHAVRAPSISELFVSPSTTTGALLDDPCASITDRGEPIAGRPVPSGVLRDVCLAQGAPVSQIGFIQQPTAGQANVTTGGNLDLQPEDSDSWTLGVVLTPEFFPGFSLSVDYYNIDVTGAITVPATGDIVGGCFSNPSLTNPNCLLIGRDANTGGLNGDQANVPGITLSRSNLGNLATNGIDIAANYRRDLGFARWALSANGNWTNASTFQATPSSVDRDCVGIYEINCTSLQPEFQWSMRNTLAFNEMFELSLLWRHIDAMKATTPLFAGEIPQLGGTYDFNRIPNFDYFDLSGRFLMGERYMLQLTVQNLFDEKPPIVGGSAAGGFNGGNTFPSTYDTLGRRFALTARVKF